MNRENLVLENLDISKRNKIFLILGIISIALIIRLWYFNPEIPITMDGLYYFRYAIDVTVLGHMPPWHLTNNGWPLFLSLFFSTIESEEFLVYMSVQKLIAIIISSLTVIPVYYLCKRFFDVRFAIIGSLLFIFEPHLIQNSIAGLSEAFFIFLTTSSLALIFSNNKKMFYISFAIASIATMVRWEGITLFLAISILYFWRFRDFKKSILKYIVLVIIFILILTPILILRMEVLGTETITTAIISGSSAFTYEASGFNEGVLSPVFYLSNGFLQLTKFLAISSIPYFVILIPIGIFILFKKRVTGRYLIIIPIIVMSITGFYAYSRGIEEIRYLFVLFPLFCVISLFPIRYFSQRVSNEKIFLVSICVIVVLSSSIFLELKNIDDEHEIEAALISNEVVTLTSKINEYYTESKYIRIGAMYDEIFPKLSYEISYGPDVAIPKGYNSLNKFISETEISHIVIDDNDDRPEFLRNVFDNESKYPYLLKVYDSRDDGFNYHVKIFQIDHVKFILEDSN